METLLPIKPEYIRDDWTPPERAGAAEPQPEEAEAEEPSTKRQKKKSVWLGNRPGAVPKAPVDLCRFFSRCAFLLAIAGGAAVPFPLAPRWFT